METSNFLQHPQETRNELEQGDILSQKPYVCNICSRSFSKSDDLKRHKRTHTGEKPFACNICGRAFGKSNDLKRHGTTHTGEKPYTCPFCGKKFSRSADMKKHARRAHPVEASMQPDLAASTHKRSPPIASISQVGSVSRVKQDPDDSGRLSPKYNTHEGVKLEPTEFFTDSSGIQQSVMNSFMDSGVSSDEHSNHQLSSFQTSNACGLQNNQSNSTLGMRIIQVQGSTGDSLLHNSNMLVANNYQDSTAGNIYQIKPEPGNPNSFVIPNDTINGFHPASSRTFQTIDASSLIRPAASTTTFQTIDVSSLRRPSDIMTLSFLPVPSLNHQLSTTSSSSFQPDLSINQTQNTSVLNGNPDASIRYLPATSVNGGNGFNTSLTPREDIPNYLLSVLKNESTGQVQQI